MSLIYKIVENCCFAVNKLTNDGIKKTDAFIYGERRTE
jgi:hypothetical protein